MSQLKVESFLHLDYKFFGKKSMCQKWDSNPRLEDQTATWTQRLRPLGHPDILLILIVNQQMAFMRRFSVTIRCALDFTRLPPARRKLDEVDEDSVATLSAVPQTTGKPEKMVID